MRCLAVLNRFLLCVSSIVSIYLVIGVLCMLCALHSVMLLGTCLSS